MYNILITGTSELSLAIQETLNEHNVTLISKKTGNDINNIREWGKEYESFDILINLAYDSWGQIELLQYFYNAWKNDPNKKIINIGSKVSSYGRSEVTLENEFWEYRLHKQCLESAFLKMVDSAICDIKLINPGPIDTVMVENLDIPKMSKEFFSTQVKEIMFNPIFKRVDIWK